MRSLGFIVALAIAVLAAPQPEAAVAALAIDAKTVAVKARVATIDGPPLDSIIDAASAEKRSPNLSILNNPKNGLFPRSCTGTCTCAKNLTPGLYCGYCTTPNNAVISCTADNEDDCFDSVYQCNGSGGCCVYGKRNSCVQREGPCDG